MSTTIDTPKRGLPLAATPLFAFVGDVDRSPSKAEKRREQVKAWKAEYGIYTHSGWDDWMALSMTECGDLLKGYGLTEEQKTDGAMLMAGYCRLLDEAGRVHYGSTEYTACESLVTRLREANASDHPTAS